MERFEFPDGSVYQVVERPADPEHQPLVMTFELAPDCPAPPPHVHPAGQTETFEVTDGWFELLVGRDWRRVDAGESVPVPPDTRHTFRNRSGQVATVRNVHDPAHSFERYISRLHAVVAGSGATSARSPKVMVPLAMLWSEHSDTIRAADPPVRIAMRAMARVGRAARVRLPDA
jgi:quercetin dioxygenase-like cupin family protein